MNKLLIILLSLSVSVTTFGKGLSAHRQPGESYEIARDRHLFLQNFELKVSNNARVEGTRRISAEKARAPLNDLDTSVITDVGSYADLENQFKYIRDNRFLTSYNPNFPRRLTWLYPDDGCYARAEVAKIELAQNNFPEPKKMFVFGNLTVASKNSPIGHVEWWYHVALTYRVGTEVYILDPALEPNHPLKLSDWNFLVGGEKTYAKYSICDQNTFDPGNDCYQPRAISPEEAISEQIIFLPEEWNRLLELKRTPEKELGEFPPWLEKS